MKKEFAVLVLLGLSSLVQADPGVQFTLTYQPSISGWNPVDDDSDPDNGPFYPPAQYNGFGGYDVRFITPAGDQVAGYRDEQYGMPFMTDHYGSPAGITVTGAYASGYLTFPSGSEGSAQISGIATNVLTLLPGVTLTIDGYFSHNWALESGNPFSYSVDLQTNEVGAPYDDTVTLFQSSGSFASGSEGRYEPFLFQFTNTSAFASPVLYTLTNLKVGTTDTIEVGNGGSVSANVSVVPVPVAVWGGMALCGMVGVGKLRRKNAAVAL